MLTKNQSVNSEKGAALIFALLGLALLTLLGLAFSFHSTIEYQMSENYVTHQEALAIADAGLNLVKKQIQTTDFTVLLSTTAQVPAYVASDVPAAGSDASRNAISTRAARNVNFNAPPTPVTTYAANGILTPVTGQPYGNGRYFAKVSNNSFGPASSLFGKDAGSPTVDTDFRVLVRVTGIRSTLGAEKVGVTRTVPNSVAVVESMVKRNTTFNLSSPLTVNGPTVTPTFNGNAFALDGGALAPGIATVNDNPPVDGTGTAVDIANATNGKGSITGTPGILGPTGPSVNDITITLRNDPDPDVRKVLDNNYVGKFVNAIRSYADTYYGSSVHLSGGTQLGTTANPSFTYVNGDLTLTGNGTGAGILVVTGNLEIGGAFTYDGIILVIGTGSAWLHGANKGINGGMYVENLTKNAQGNYISGNADVRISGNSVFTGDSSKVRLGLSLLPLEMLEWREITPEIAK